MQFNVRIENGSEIDTRRNDTRGNSSVGLRATCPCSFVLNLHYYSIMIRRNIFLLALMGALIWLCCGCQSGQPKLNANEKTAKLQTYLDQQTQFWTVRHDMAPIARQIAIVIPVDCDVALRDIKDPQIREYILNIAASAGLYASNRVWASDPRVGLADLIITTHSIEQTIKSMATKGPYPSLSPMIQTMTSIMADLEILGQRWLEPEVQAQIQKAILDDAKHNWTPTADLMKVNEMLTTKFKEPIGIQIDSSFLQFDDNGLFERGISELHDMNLAAEKASAVLGLMPTAFELRARRAMLMTLNEPIVVEMRANIAQMAVQLKELRELQGLQELKQLEELKNLQAMKDLKELKGLDQLQALQELKNLDDIKNLQELQGLRPLKSLEELVEFKWKLAILVACGFFAQTLVLVWAIRSRR